LLARGAGGKRKKKWPAVAGTCLVWAGNKAQPGSGRTDRCSMGSRGPPRHRGTAAGLARLERVTKNWPSKPWPRRLSPDRPCWPTNAGAGTMHRAGGDGETRDHSGRLRRRRSQTTTPWAGFRSACSCGRTCSGGPGRQHRLRRAANRAGRPKPTTPTSTGERVALPGRLPGAKARAAGQNVLFRRRGGPRAGRHIARLVQSQRWCGTRLRGSAQPVFFLPVF